MRVRRVQAGDAAALARVHVRTWQVAYQGHVPQEYLDGLDLAARQAQWERWIHDMRPPVGTSVLEHETDGVVGFIHVSPSRDADTDPAVVGEVGGLYVLPAYWGTGGGRLLMAEGVGRLVAAGYHEAILWVLGSNARARRFYEAVGWQPDGATKTDDSRGFPLFEVRYRRGFPAVDVAM
jgi:GNAT superfamily N-acetyltransferase